MRVCVCVKALEWVNLRSEREKIILTLSKRGASVTITIQVFVSFEEKESRALQPCTTEDHILCYVKYCLVNAVPRLLFRLSSPVIESSLTTNFWCAQVGMPHHDRGLYQQREYLSEMLMSVFWTKGVRILFFVENFSCSEGEC